MVYEDLARRQLPAGCLVAMEASSSAHHWARKLVALGLDAGIIAAHLVALYRGRFQTAQGWRAVWSLAGADTTAGLQWRQE